MTLDDFKEMLVGQRAEIARHIQEAKIAFNTAPEINSLNAAKQRWEMWDMKLDMLNWIIQQANKIELPTTKMREFL